MAEIGEESLLLSNRKNQIDLEPNNVSNDDDDDDDDDDDELSTIQAAGAKYADFMEALSEFHEKTDALSRTIDNEAEPAMIEYILAALFFWCYPWFRRWLDGHPPADPSQLIYYQRAFHSYKAADLDLNAFSALPLNYCKSFFQQLVKAFLGFAIQIAFLITVSLSLFTEQNIWQNIGDVSDRVMTVAVASSLLLIFLMRDQFRGTLVSARFFSWYHEIYRRYWLLFLLEAWSNFGISMFLFYLNLVVVLSSDSVEEAVLNSVAIFFITQIDELLVPDYRSDDSKDNAFAVELFRHYCHESHEVSVDFPLVEEELAKKHRYWCRIRCPFLKRK